MEVAICVPQPGLKLPEATEKGGKLLLHEIQGLELTECLKLVEWRS